MTDTEYKYTCFECGKNLNNTSEDAYEYKEGYKCEECAQKEYDEATLFYGTGELS